MAENVKTNAAGAAAEAPAKKKRRGINNQTQATTRLRFHEKDASRNGLFVGQLESISVEWSVNADGKQFTGMKMPRLQMVFTSRHADDAQKRYLTHSILPVESNVNTIPNGSEDWKVNNAFNWIKHILDVYYLKGRQMTELEEDALSLAYEDYDDEGNYIPVDPQDVLDSWATMFNNVVAMMDGRFNLPDGETPKPCYKDANGKPLAIWMKLLRAKKRKGEWIHVGQNGELDFDQFIGAGVIELMIPNKEPGVLRIDMAKESITPKEVKKTPSVGVPAMGGVPVPGDMGMGMPMDNSAFAAAGEDMPF